jgi:hypothetical protein
MHFNLIFIFLHLTNEALIGRKIGHVLHCNASITKSNSIFIFFSSCESQLFSFKLNCIFNNLILIKRNDNSLSIKQNILIVSFLSFNSFCLDYSKKMAKFLLVFKDIKVHFKNTFQKKFDLLNKAESSLGYYEPVPNQEL